MIAPTSFLLAYALDWLIGDPLWLPHPVRWMGRLIQIGERSLRPLGSTPGVEFVSGLILTIIVVATFGIGSWVLLLSLSSWNQSLAMVVTLYLATSTLATRTLIDEASVVKRFLENGELLSARQQVARIVGRDTHKLDEPEIIRAVTETLAESTSDGIVAPMFYLAIGGVPLALAYKAINTLDSMIGHRGKHYEYFGKSAARLDDVVNFIPARLTALLTVIFMNDKPSGVISLPPRLPQNEEELKRAIILLGNRKQVEIKSEARRQLEGLIGVYPTVKEAALWKRLLRRACKGSF